MNCQYFRKKQFSFYYDKLQPKKNKTRYGIRSTFPEEIVHLNPGPQRKVIVFGVHC